MITEVRYERLYNLGNFENVKYGATASVDEDAHTLAYALAYAECREAVEEQHALFLAERKANDDRQRAEWQRQSQEQLNAIRQRNDEEPAF